MIITLDGTSGSGKNTIASLLAKKYHLKEYSMGDLMRKIAKKRGMTIQELQELRKKDETIDREVDQHQAELGRQEDNFVITGRPSHHFIPHAVKIFLKVKPEVAAHRIWKDLQISNKRNEKKYHSEQELADSIRHRDQEDWKIYHRLYDIDVNLALSYDLVIDTSTIPAEQVVNVIAAFLERKKNHDNI
jgi:CMP/dCMP kinase